MQWLTCSCVTIHTWLPLLVRLLPVAVLGPPSLGGSTWAEASSSLLPSSRFTLVTQVRDSGLSHVRLPCCPGWLGKVILSLDYFKKGHLHKATHSTDTAVSLKQRPSCDPILLSSVFFTMSRAHHPCLSSLTDFLGRRSVLSHSTLLGLLRGKNRKCWWQAQLGLYFPSVCACDFGGGWKGRNKTFWTKVFHIGFLFCTEPSSWSLEENSLFCFQLGTKQIH